MTRATGLSPLLLGAAMAVAATVLAASLFPPPLQRMVADKSVPFGPPQAQPTAAEPPPDGALVVTDSGYTVYMDGDIRRLSWGAVVTNTAAEPLASGIVTLDAEVGDLHASPSGATTLLAPGASGLVGSTMSLPDGKVTGVAITVAETRWWTGVPPPAAITATDVEVTPIDGGTSFLLGFRIESEAAEMHGVQYRAVFRDEDGRLLGVYEATDGDSRIPPGSSIRGFDVDHGLPPGTVEDTIEVHVRF